MTTSTYSPALLQSAYGQSGPYSPQGQFGFTGFDQQTPFQQQFAAWTPYGQQGIEQILPTIQLINYQLTTAQQCVWSAQHLLTQVMTQVAQTQQLPMPPSTQFGLPFGQPAQRQLPRQYPMAW